MALLVPSLASDPQFRAHWARAGQRGASPAVARAQMKLVFGGDVRSALPSIDVPTLVMHRPENALIAAERVLATVLFTDVVQSTERLVDAGDRDWRVLLDRHDAMVRAQLARFRGREVSTAGDSFFAVFDSPARAVRCAQAIVQGAVALGIGVRAGVHTGECEIRGSDYSGIAVHIGARVAGLAGAGEVLTTGTVKDLVAGSGIAFSDRGDHTLKGVPDAWRIFAATA